MSASSVGSYQDMDSSDVEQHTICQPMYRNFDSNEENVGDKCSVKLREEIVFTAESNKIPNSNSFDTENSDIEQSSNLSTEYNEVNCLCSNNVDSSGSSSSANENSSQKSKESIFTKLNRIRSTEKDKKWEDLPFDLRKSVIRAIKLEAIDKMKSNQSVVSNFQAKERNLRPKKINYKNSNKKSSQSCIHDHKPYWNCLFCKICDVESHRVKNEPYIQHDSALLRPTHSSMMRLSQRHATGTLKEQLEKPHFLRSVTPHSPVMPPGHEMPYNSNNSKKTKARENSMVNKKLPDAMKNEAQGFDKKQASRFVTKSDDTRKLIRNPGRVTNSDDVINLKRVPENQTKCVSTDIFTKKNNVSVFDRLWHDAMLKQSLREDEMGGLIRGSANSWSTLMRKNEEMTWINALRADKRAIKKSPLVSDGDFDEKSYSRQQSAKTTSASTNNSRMSSKVDELISVKNEHGAKVNNNLDQDFTLFSKLKSTEDINDVSSYKHSQQQQKQTQQHSLDIKVNPMKNPLFPILQTAAAPYQNLRNSLLSYNYVPNHPSKLGLSRNSTTSLIPNCQNTHENHFTSHDMVSTRNQNNFNTHPYVNQQQQLNINQPTCHQSQFSQPTYPNTQHYPTAQMRSYTSSLVPGHQPTIYHTPHYQSHQQQQLQQTQFLPNRLSLQQMHYPADRFSMPNNKYFSRNVSNSQNTVNQPRNLSSFQTIFGQGSQVLTHF